MFLAYTVYDIQNAFKWKLEEKRIFCDIFEPATTLRDRQGAFRIGHIDHRTDKLAFFYFSKLFLAKHFCKKTYQNKNLKNFNFFFGFENHSW